MRVIIVGCGQVGSALAYQLYWKGHQVTVIDQDQSAFDSLPIDFHGRTIEGDVLTKNTLHRAEIEGADALAAVTSSDSLNALVAHIAKTEYQVTRVIARNNDPRHRPLQEAFGVPVGGSPSWGAQRIEDLLVGDPLRAIHLDSNTNFAIYQLEVPDTWHGHPLGELLPGNQGKTLALTRAGQPLPVSNNQSLEAGDLVFLTADPQEIEMLRRRLGNQQERSS
jgi:trk system potassium uptake protein TrkA